MEKTLSAPTRLRGTLQVPSDKSLTHRAVLFSALAEGTSVIDNPLTGEDCLSTVSAVEALGCRVDKEATRWTVHGKGLWGFTAPAAPLNCGNSGTTIRLISGILAAQNFKTTLTGDASLTSRPMDRVAKPLEAMGARFKLRDGKYAPFEIEGTRNLSPIRWKNPIASAQVKSAVLLAGLHAKGETIFEEPAQSRDHTERMLASCGVPISSKGGRVSLVGPAPLKAQSWRIPGDFSSAAFFIVAGLLFDGADVHLESVNLNPTRIGLLTVLRQMGAKIGVVAGESGGEPLGTITVKGSQPLHSVSMDPAMTSHLIDEVPILAVAATQATGVTVLTGLEELRVKETDRLKAMTTNLRAMGAHVTERPDGLVIEGPTPLQGAVVESYDDHRIAMAMAVAALMAQGPTTIRGAEAVAISFPSFWDVLDRLTNR